MGSMRALLTRSFDPGERRRLAGFFGAVGLLHIVGWGLLLAYGASHPGFLALGGLAGTLVSGGFLVLIGILNLVILFDIVRVYRKMRRGEYDRDGLEHELISGGVMTRIFGRMLRII